MSTGVVCLSGKSSECQVQAWQSESTIVILLHLHGWNSLLLRNSFTTAMLFFAGIFALASISMALVDRYCTVPTDSLAMDHHFGTKPDSNDTKDDVLSLRNLEWKHFALTLNTSFLTWSALLFLAAFVAYVPESILVGYLSYYLSLCFWFRWLDTVLSGRWSHDTYIMWYSPYPFRTTTSSDKSDSPNRLRVIARVITVQSPPQFPQRSW